MKFYDREKETKELLRIHQLTIDENSRMTLVTGRRRIGKTTLVQRAYAGQELVYLYVKRRNEKELVSTFCTAIRAQLNIFIPDGISRFIDLLRMLMEYSKTHPFTLVLDEFQEFVHVNLDVFQDMQELWDTYHQTTHLNLIISGSAYRLIQNIFMDKGEPLFNRADFIIRLKPFALPVLKQIFDDYAPIHNNDDLLALYMITGGVPKYIAWLLDNNCLTYEDMYRYIFSDMSHFLEEGNTLLVSEFGKNYGVYFSILQELAAGHQTQAAIETQLGGISIGGYLRHLEDTFQLIARERPILAKKETQTVRFKIKDNFLRFWFRYADKYHFMVEMQNYEGLCKIALNDYPTYSGIILEQYFRQQLAESGLYKEVNAWWQKRAIVHKDNKIDAEVDVVALSIEGRKALVGEVKRNRERYDHELFMAKVDYLKQTALRGYSVETKLFDIQQM